MGHKCSCLQLPPPEGSYNQKLIKPTSKLNIENGTSKTPSPININAPIIINNISHNIPKLSINNISNRISLSSYKNKKSFKKELAIYNRIQYTTNGITAPISSTGAYYATNGNNNTYHRLNTYSASLNFNIDDSLSCSDGYDINKETFDNEHMLKELEFHRIITFGYISNETQTLSINIPLCIIELCRKYYFALKPIRRKRVIFTSIVQLNLCIDKIPKFILDESIFFFKINKMELIQLFNSKFNLLHNNNENNNIYRGVNRRETFDVSTNSDSTSVINDLHPIFIRYLKQKYDSNLLLILDDNTSWYEISNKLELISDTWYNGCNNGCKGNTYSSLILNNIYWQNNNYKYDTKCIDILEEINNGLLKYAPSMEILYQSNPTLIPMKIFDINQYHLQNGYNTQYISMNTKTRNTIHIIPNDPNDPNDNECAHISMDDTNNTGTITTNTPPSNKCNYYHYHNTTPSNVDHDLVVLSMYNSGNDVSELSKTSYCYDQSYTANDNDDNFGDLNTCNINNIDFAVMNCSKLFNNVNIATNITPVPDNIITPNTNESNSGCHICVNYHKYQ